MADAQTSQPRQPFAPQDAKQILDMMLGGSALTCPSCSGELTTSIVAGGGSIAAVWEVRCGSCDRGVIVTDHL